MASFPFSLVNGGITAGAALAVFIGCVIFGAVVAPARYRLRAADGVVGIGIATGILTLLGATLRFPLSIWAALLAVAAVICGVVLVRRRDMPGGMAMWVALAALVPFLPRVATIPALHWDELRHWLLVAGYLIRFDSFPHPDLPPSPALVPAYPQAGPLFVWLVSLLAGRWAESGGALLAVLLLASFVPILGDVVRAVRPNLSTSLPLATKLALITAGLVLVLPLNPGFDRTFSLTALVDIPTAVATGTAAVLGWLILERLREGEQAKAVIPALQFGIVTAFLLNLKQSNLVLAALLFGGLVLLVLRDPYLRLGPCIRLLPPMLLPGAVVYGVWRIYVGAYLQGGELAVLPFKAWRVHRIPEILDAMARQAAAHPIFFALLAVLTILGLVGLVRLRGPVDRLLTVVSVLTTGYIAFLGFVYVSSLSDPEALRAAEFWRYSTHLGLLALTGITALAAQFWPTRGISDRWIRPVGLTMPVVLTLALAWNAKWLLPPMEAPGIVFQLIGRELAKALPNEAVVSIISPLDCSYFDAVIQYEFLLPTNGDHYRRIVNSGLLPADFAAGEAAGDLLRKAEANYFLILATPQSCMDGTTAAWTTLKVFLWERTERGWIEAAHWP